MKLFPISASGVEKRWLRPAYRFSNSLMAWQCAVCGKIFSITVEEARSAAQLPPPHIEQEFQLHSCELHSFDRFSDVELYYVGSGPEGRQYEIRTTAYGRTRRTRVRG
jgi:hypothetical protein